MDNEEEKFPFLVNVKPLQDLAKNWDIDIASCLQDYLTELAQVGHPVPHSALPPSLSLLEDESEEKEGVKGKTNFAQAALILQNSSFVYSRKVEYLYSLVYAALNDLIANTTLKQGKNDSTSTGKKQSSKQNTDKDLEEFEMFDPQMEFLLLDHVLPVDDKGDKINLKPSSAGTANREEESPYTHHRTSMMTDNTRHPPTSTLNTTLRTSLGTNQTMSISRMERSFVDIVIGAFGDGGGGTSGPDALKYSSTARATLDAIMNHGGGNSKGTNEVSLRLLHGGCDIDDRGTLLIPGSSIPNMYEDYTSLRQEDHNTLHSRLARAAVTTETTIQGNEGGDITTDKRVAETDTYPNGNNDVGEGQGFGNYCDDDNDDSVEGAAFQFHDDNSTTSHDKGVENDQPTSSSIVFPSSTRHLRTRNNPDQDVQDTEGKKLLDPWLLMDPHDPGSSKSCPLRIGKTYKLPSGIDKLPSESVTGARSKRGHIVATSKSQGEKKAKTVDYVSIATLDSILTNYEHWMLHIQRYRDSAVHADSVDDDIPNIQFYTVPSKGLIFGDEFSYIIEAQKKLLKEKPQQPTNVQKKVSVLRNDDVKENNDIGGTGDDQDDDNEGMGYGMDYGADYDDDTDDHVIPMDDEHVNVSLHRFDEVFGSENATSVDDKHQYLSFKDLCQRHVDKFKEGAERYAVETQLSKRVSIWQDRLATILDEEESRPEFNIQSYGKKILNKVHTAIAPCETKYDIKSQQTVEYFKVVSNHNEYEVCRLFLATLMLCNSENIAFVDDENIPGTIATPETLKVALLNSNLASPLDSYSAPSMAI